MNNRVAVRFVLGLFLIAILVFVFQWWRNASQDLGALGSADTAGDIAMIEFLDEGSRAMILRPNGEFIESPGYREGARDMDLAWQPDGNRLFFTSDREDRTFNIFRWNPGRNVVERRSLGSRSQGRISFGPSNVPNANRAALITAGGFVMEYDAVEAATRQALPPTAREIARDDGNATNQFEMLYRRLGESFRAVRWGKNRDTIIAVMRREGGEVLVVQDMKNLDEPPTPIAAGREIEFDVSYETGKVVFTVQAFQWPDLDRVPEEFVKDGVAVAPFQHFIGFVDATNADKEPMTLIGVSPNDETCFSSPIIDPTGDSFVCRIGSYDENQGFIPKELATMPVREGAIQSSSVLFRGAIYEPNWNPNGQSLVFCMRNDSGKRAVFQLNRDGSGLKDLTGDRGDFSFPTYSPQRTSG
ncbi:MAG: hypothetical protein ACK4XJ_03130 [Fimbriimonadaceae bacterium]